MARGYVNLFQYGSNMDPERLNHISRLKGRAKVLGIGRLDHWGIRFDLFSITNQCGVTDIMEVPGEYTLGVIYSVPTALIFRERGQRSKMDKIEGAKSDGKGNYVRKVVRVLHEGKECKAVTYIGTETGRKRFRLMTPAHQRVDAEYFAHLLSGAKRNNLPQDYIAYLKDKAGPLG